MCCSRAFSKSAAVVLQAVCVRAIRSRLGDMAGAGIAEGIIGLLRPKEVVLAGGVVWSGLVQEDWFMSDIDIFLTYGRLEIVSAALVSLGLQLQTPAMGTERLVPPWTTVSHWRTAVWFVRTYTDGLLKVDLVVVSNSMELALSTLDLLGCASHFDGQTVVITQPSMTLAKKTLVNPHRLALINGFAVVVAGFASGCVSMYLSRSQWFAGLDGAVESIRRSGFDQSECVELMDAVRSRDMSAVFCKSVCPLKCSCKRECTAVLLVKL